MYYRSKVTVPSKLKQGLFLWQHFFRFSNYKNAPQSGSFPWSAHPGESQRNIAFCLFYLCPSIHCFLLFMVLVTILSWRKEEQPRILPSPMDRSRGFALTDRGTESLDSECNIVDSEVLTELGLEQWSVWNTHSLGDESESSVYNY